MSKFAVIETGGKQYLIRPGEQVAVELLPGVAGDKIAFDRVLLTGEENSVKVGRPHLKTEVKAKIIEQTRDKKKQGIKYQGSGYRRKFGHRQKLTVIEVTKI